MKEKVTQIELSDKHIVLRIILVVVFLIIGITGIVFGVKSCMEIPAGWTVIKANTKDDNCSADFSFNYYLGKSKFGISDEKTILQNAYSDYSVYTFREFNADTLYDNTKNVAYLNAHPNEEVKVSNLLYNSLKKIADNDSPYLFYGPIYYEYEALLSLHSEEEMKTLDPNYSSTQANYFNQILNFVNNGKISISILENSSVRLNVSDDYLAFIKENEITRIIDFYRLKNAFIADFMAENLRSEGFKNGYIVSSDGYLVNLGEEAVSAVYTKLSDNKVSNVATFNLTGASSMVMYRSYPYLTTSLYHYYQDGKRLSTYINKEGKYETSIDTLFVYANDKSIAELAIKSYYLFATKELNLASLDATNKYAYVVDNKFMTNDDKNTAKLIDGYEKVVVNNA